MAQTTDREGIHTNSQKSHKTVSVVIPALNEERYLAACLQSIEHTSRHVVLEIIVVDNGSADKTTEIAAQLGALVIHSQVSTIAAQRNLAPASPRENC